MEKKRIQVGNFSIAYFEQNAEAKQTIFFLHGNSGSSLTWRKQINDPLFSSYRQIAIDLPGHGESSKSIDPERDYAPITTARILTEVISTLSKDDPYILAGFSYSTNLIGEMLTFDINPSGIVLMGLCCLGKDFGMEKVFKPSELPSIFFYNERDRRVVEHSIKENVRSQEDIDMITNDYFKTDEQFRPALMKAAGEGNISDEILSLKTTGLPLCIINGALDRLAYPDYIQRAELSFWRGGITILSEARHFVPLDMPAEVNNLIASYAKEVFTPAHV
ncbi:MAG TPA: alpha/beta hydrolase [Paludibacter sp.]|nr:alpha/beta hydrolase [Paludibacter sp.]